MSNLKQATRYEMTQIIARLAHANQSLRAENAALRTQLEAIKWNALNGSKPMSITTTPKTC